MSRCAVLARELEVERRAKDGLAAVLDADVEGALRERGAEGDLELVALAVKSE